MLTLHSDAPILDAWQAWPLWALGLMSAQRLRRKSKYIPDALEIKAYSSVACPFAVSSRANASHWTEDYFKATC